MIEGNKNISDVFSIFHDGIICNHRLIGEDLILSVEIMYLAERVSPRYTKFQVRLHSVDDIRFTTWPSDVKSEPEELRGLGEIFRPNLDILESSVQSDAVQVVCNQTDPDFDYCGGELLFRARSIEVEDEAGREYSLEELAALCKAYWDDWARTNQDRE